MAIERQPLKGLGARACDCGVVVMAWVMERLPLKGLFLTLPSVAIERQPLTRLWVSLVCLLSWSY